MESRFLRDAIEDRSETGRNEFGPFGINPCASKPCQSILNGFYQRTGSPYVTYTIKNPAGSTADVEELHVTETRGADSWTCKYAYSSSLESWTLDYVYNTAGQTDLETYAGSFMDTFRIDHTYDNRLRRSQVRVKNSTNPSSNLITGNYYYHTDTGRLRQVAYGSLDME